MSLKIDDRATPKQIQTLKDLDYIGKWDLSSDEATKIIGELFEERRMELDQEKAGGESYADWYNNKERE